MHVSLKAIAKEIGRVDGNKVSAKQSFLMVCGAREILVERAFDKNHKIGEVTSPSESQLRRLAAKLVHVKV